MVRGIQSLLQDVRLNPDSRALVPSLLGPVRDHGPLTHAGTTDVATFRNLRGDAMLVAPCRSTPADAYVHIAKFVRAAPRDQVLSQDDPVKQ